MTSPGSFFAFYCLRALFVISVVSTSQRGFYLVPIVLLLLSYNPISFGLDLFWPRVFLITRSARICDTSVSLYRFSIALFCTGYKFYYLIVRRDYEDQLSSGTLSTGPTLAFKAPSIVQFSQFFVLS